MGLGVSHESVNAQRQQFWALSFLYYLNTYQYTGHEWQETADMDFIDLYPLRLI